MSAGEPTTTTRRLSGDEVRDAIRDTIISQTVGSVMPHILLQGGVLALLVLTLGGSMFEAGLIYTINSVAQMVSILAAPRIDVQPYKPFVVRGFVGELLTSCGYLGVGVVAGMFGERVAVAWVLLVYLFSRIAVQWGATAWIPLLCEILPPGIRGRYFGRMRTAGRVSAFFAVLAAGWWMGDEPTVERFYPILAVILCFSALRVFIMMRVPSPPAQREGPPEPIVRNLARPLRDRDFRRFMIYVAVSTIPRAGAVPYIVPFIRQQLGFPAWAVTWVTMGMGVGMILSLMRWGRIADRWGNRYTFMIGTALSATMFVILAAAPTWSEARWQAFAFAFAAFLMHGFGAAGIGIAQTVRLTREAPDDQRGPYMSLFKAVIGLTASLSAVGVGAIIHLMPEQMSVRGETLLSMRILFCAACGMVLLSGPMIRILRPLGEGSMTHVVHSLIDVLPGPLGLPLRPLAFYLRNTPRLTRDSTEAR